MLWSKSGHVTDMRAPSKHNFDSRRPMVSENSCYLVMTFVDMLARKRRVVLLKCCYRRRVRLDVSSTTVPSGTRRTRSKNNSYLT